MTKCSQFDKKVSDMRPLYDIRIEFKADEEQNSFTIECYRNGKLVYSEMMEVSIYMKMCMYENPVHKIVSFLNPHSFNTEECRDSDRNVKKHFNPFGVWFLKLFGKYKKLSI